MTDQATSESTGARLGSWKEIAAHFGKDERTVKRWEVARGLPVHRVPGGTRTSVFAYANELDAWLSAPRPRPHAAPAVSSPPRRNNLRRLLLAGAIAIIGIAGLAYAAGRLAPDTHAAPQVSADVRALYDQGVLAWSSRTADGFGTAIERFEAALDIAPDYAAAHAGLAHVYNLISQYTAAPAEASYARARQEAERAIALDPASADAYAALGFNAFYGQHDFNRAFELFEKSLSLAPDQPQTLHWYALTSMQTGKFERPLQLIDRAMALNPEARSIRANAALIHYYSGDVEGALAMLAQLRQADPDYLAVPSYLATIYLDQQRYREFLDNYEIAARIEGRDGRLRVAEAARAALPAGGTAMLEAMFDEQVRQFDVGAEEAYKVAGTAALLGRTDIALAYLATAVQRRETLGLLVEPEFRTLRAQPRFVALVKQLGLPSS